LASSEGGRGNVSAGGYEAVFVEIAQLISRFWKKDVTGEMRLLQDLNLDSVEVMELVAEIEDHFHVVIPMEILLELQTVGDLTVCLVTLIEQQRSPSL
jgi:acyl carrier protein